MVWNITEIRRHFAPTEIIMNIIEYLSNIPGRNFEIHYCYIAGKQGLFYILLIDHFIEINLTLVRLILSDFYYRIKAAFNVEPSVGGF